MSLTVAMRSGRVFAPVIITALLCIAQATANGAEPPWQHDCELFARIPLACREAPQPLPDTGVLPDNLANRLQKMSVERAVALVDTVVLSDDNASWNRSIGAAHLARGALFELQTRSLDALCDYQAAVARSAFSARATAAALLQRVAKEEERRFEELDAANHRAAAALAVGTSLTSTRLRRLQHEWRVEHVAHSTAIEGNTLTPTHVRALLETRVTQAAGTPLRDIDEVLGTNAAFNYILAATAYGTPSAATGWLTGQASVPPPTLQLLLEIHRRVLAGSAAGQADIAGQWRKVSVRIANHAAPAAASVPAMMTELEQHWNSAGFLALHPVEQAALAHFELVWVHPFEDGNGRTARLLSSYLLLRKGFVPLNLRLIQQQAYYNALASSHSAAGGCTRRLVELFRGSVERLQTELAQTISPSPTSPSIVAPPAAPEADVAQVVGADGETADDAQL